jgi:hypothetical protein
MKVCMISIACFFLHAAPLICFENCIPSSSLQPSSYSSSELLTTQVQNNGDNHPFPLLPSSSPTTFSPSFPLYLFLLPPPPPPLFSVSSVIRGNLGRGSLLYHLSLSPPSIFLFLQMGEKEVDNGCKPIIRRYPFPPPTPIPRALTPIPLSLYLPPLPARAT